MQTNLLCTFVAICLMFVPSEIEAQEKQGEILHGVIESVDGKTIPFSHRRKSRTFTINDKTQINYVRLLKAKEEIESGLFVRAGVDSQGQGDQFWATLPIPKAKVTPSGGMRNMTPVELHKMADSNGGGELSYVQYSTAIYRSPNQSLVAFGKADKDNSGILICKNSDRS